MLMRRVSPLGSVLAGTAAGAIGALGQSVFFSTTARFMPDRVPGAFEPPEMTQREEWGTETVARRFVEGLMQRGPLTEAAKRRAATIVHVLFGSLWGGLYGVARESYPELDRPLGVLGYSLVVWNTSDNVILPAFRVAALPHKYPLRNHMYAIAAHLVYGASVWGAYRALRRTPYFVQAAVLFRALPGFVRWPLLRRAVKSSAKQAVKAPTKNLRKVAKTVTQRLAT